MLVFFLWITFQEVTCISEPESVLPILMVLLAGLDAFAFLMY